MTVTITEPGIYWDLDEKDYHAQHDWASWSMLKKLIPPSTPAHLKASMNAGEERKRHFDLGKVTHALVLGEGAVFVVVEAKRRDGTVYNATDYATKAAQDHRDAIYDSGRTPILAHELDQAMAMADAVKAHPVANHLLTGGTPEVSLFWVDDATGVKCRARLDYLPAKTPGHRLVVPDFKTARTAAPAEFVKTAARLGYYGQQHHYSQGIRACGIDPDPEFVFVVAETTDPNPVIVARFDTREDLRLAAAVVDRCLRIYNDCTRDDEWPAYPGGVLDLALPPFIYYDLEAFVETPEMAA